MKKLLIATSAVVGLGLVSADFAAAQLETSVSGLIRVRLKSGADATFDLHDDDKTKKVDQETWLDSDKSRINWAITGTSDSGLNYGGQVRWEDGSSEAYANIFFGNDAFGQITVGKVDAAKSSAAAGVSGAIDGATTRWAGGKNVTGNHGGTDRILYVGTFSGLTIAADYYTDSNADEDDGGKSGVSAAVKYGGEFADGSFNIAAGLHRGNTDDTAAVAAAAGDANDINDASTATKLAVNAVNAKDGQDDEGYGIGADVTFGPITVGANYRKFDEKGVDNLKDIALSAAYDFGAGTASIGFGRLSGEGDGSVKTFAAGVNYTVAPGWTVYGEAARNRAKGGGDSLSDTNWVLGTDLAF